MGSIETDASGLPLFVVRFHGVVDDEAFDRYLHELRVQLDGEQRYALLLDARHAGVTGPAQRRRQAEFLRDHRDTLARLCVGTAFVIANPLVRGVLTAILWLQPLPSEYVVVGTLEEAEHWCRRKLAAVGL